MAWSSSDEEVWNNCSSLSFLLLSTADGIHRKLQDRLNAILDKHKLALVLCLAEVFKQLTVVVPRDTNDSPLDIHTTADCTIIISAWPLISFHFAHCSV